MKRYFEAAFLLLVIASITYSSELWFLGVPAAGFVAYYLRAHLANKTPLYKKSVAYGMIVPFFFWWFLSPTNGSVFSPWLLIIPSWYFTFLALWQWRSIGRGGYPVFVIWNSIFVLLFALREADRVQYALIALALFAFVLSVKPPKRYLHFAVFFALTLACSALFVFGFQKAYEWRANKMRSGEWEENYRNERSMMGFSTVAALGSFKTNYLSERNSQVVLRLWTDKAPRFLRAVAYKDYSAGVWNIPRDEEWLQSERYIGDYAVFGTEDSVTKPVWVQAALGTFDFAFTPPGSGVAFKAADSIARLVGGSFKTPSENRSDWYYIPSANADTLDSAQFLNTPSRLHKFLAFADSVIGIDSTTPAREATEKINGFFMANFKYELNVPFGHKKSGGEDPLISFWFYRTGFCEYFASLEVLLLRHIGVPARYVTGFAWPTKAPSGNYFVFRRSNSHAWVEVFDKGWQISDPTPPAPPEMFDFEFAGRDRFMETLRSKFIYFMHVLRDGEWRKSLDSWSNVIENTLSSIWLKFILGILLAALLARYGYKRYKAFAAKEKVSEKVASFERMLKHAEKTLAHFGIRRMPGETEYAFLLRVKKMPLPQKSSAQKKFQSAIAQLEKYDTERWKL